MHNHHHGLWNAHFEDLDIINPLFDENLTEITEPVAATGV
jgi:hypothetical protein